MSHDLIHSSLPAKRILGIDVSVVDLPRLLEVIEGLVRRDRTALVNNVNVHACNLAYEQPAFREILNASEVVFCDGFGVKLAGWLTGQRLGQRMTPPDWIDELFSLCVENGYSVYFLGDERAVLRLFVDEVKRRFPELNIAGHRDGFFDMEGVENEQVVADVAASRADIIITGMGMPRQEQWAWEAKDRLDKGVVIAAGALFRWYAGAEQRAPKWVTGCGLEWLARLAASPKRHFKRYVIGLPLFYWRVIRCHWFKAGGAGHG